MRIHKYVYEAFMRCKIQSFEEWLVEVNDASSPITRFEKSKLVSELIRDPNNETLSSCLEELEKVFELYERFENEIQNELGPTASYWNSYLDMVQTLLDCQWSLRTGDWDLHLRATEKSCHGSMPLTILIMLGILHIMDALSRILEIHILGCVKLTLINTLVQKGHLGASTVCHQNKILSKQLTKSRRVKAVLSVAAYQRAQYKGES